MCDDSRSFRQMSTKRVPAGSCVVSCCPWRGGLHQAGVWSQCSCDEGRGREGMRSLVHGYPVGDGGRGVPSVSWEESRVSEVGSLKAASTGEGQRGIPAGVRAGVGAPRPVERQPSAASPPPLVIIAARVLRCRVPATCWGPTLSATDGHLFRAQSPQPSPDGPFLKGLLGAQLKSGLPRGRGLLQCLAASLCHVPGPAPGSGTLRRRHRHGPCTQTAPPAL